MLKFFKYTTIAIACFLAFACHFRVSPRVSSDMPDEYYRNMHNSKVEKIETDYMANCKVSVKSRSYSSSGSCELIFTRRGQFRFEVLHPFGGTLSVFYMDRDNIQILDATAKKFYQLPNSEENRRRVFPIAGIALNELQDILWGRKILSNDNRLEFSLDNDTRRPREIIRKDKPGLVVRYLKWLKYKNNLFPKIIKMEDAENNVSLKLAITEFSPGSVQNAEIGNVPEDYQRAFSLFNSNAP